MERRYCGNHHEVYRISKQYLRKRKVNNTIRPTSSTSLLLFYFLILYYDFDENINFPFHMILLSNFIFIMFYFFKKKLIFLSVCYCTCLLLSTNIRITFNITEARCCIDTKRCSNARPPNSLVSVGKLNRLQHMKDDKTHEKK
jgi:hypothetical protein